MQVHDDVVSLCQQPRCRHDATVETIFCGHHHARNVMMMAELPYTRLSLSLAFRVKPPGAGTGGKNPEPSVPVNVHADELAGNIDDLVASMYDVLAIDLSFAVRRGRTFADKCGAIYRSLAMYYTHTEMRYRHWVPSDKVSALPDHTEGRVTASGDAIVIDRIPRYESLILLDELYGKAKRD